MMLRKTMIGGALALASVAIGVGPAGACGFLVAPNGAVELLRTTTLASWENGVEHYVTSFEFSSEQTSFGSIIPLPSEPTTVERAGDWTLQRLRREVEPPAAGGALATTAVPASAADKAVVLQQVQVDSLDVTVLRGGGKEVVEWAKTNGFDIDPTVTTVLERYGNRSPYFMAAKFDATRAKASNFRSGDGIPIHLELPLDRPWVPLEILAAGKEDNESVQADVFLLTPVKPTFGSLDKGVVIERSRPATSTLLDDLRSDKNSTWVPDKAYLTHVSIDSSAAKLKRDLVPLVAPVPHAPLQLETLRPAGTNMAWTMVAALGGIVVGASVVGATTRRRSSARI